MAIKPALMKVDPIYHKSYVATFIAAIRNISGTVVIIVVAGVVFSTGNACMIVRGEDAAQLPDPTARPNDAAPAPVEVVHEKKNVPLGEVADPALNAINIPKGTTYTPMIMVKDVVPGSPNEISQLIEIINDGTMQWREAFLRMAAVKPTKTTLPEIQSALLKLLNGPNSSMLGIEFGRALANWKSSDTLAKLLNMLEDSNHAAPNNSTTPDDVNHALLNGVTMPSETNIVTTGRLSNLSPAAMPGRMPSALPGRNMSMQDMPMMNSGIPMVVNTVSSRHRMILRVLGAFAEPDVALNVTKCLSTGDHDAAAASLVNMGEVAEKPVLKFLQDLMRTDTISIGHEFDSAREALAILREVGTEKSISTLVDIIHTVRYPQLADDARNAALAIHMRPKKPVVTQPTTPPTKN